jgi:hypothetical protein
VTSTLKQLRASRVSRAVCYLLLISLTSLFLHYSIDGILGQSRSGALQNAPIKGPDGARLKIANKPGLALNKITINLSFLSAFSLIRFDLKQNLRLWPVLSDGLQRSPPSF